MVPKWISKKFFVIELMDIDANVLMQEATKRGITQTQLLTKIITLCIDDKLFDAILDEKAAPCQTKR
jgi:hypothetical protein